MEFMGIRLNCYYRDEDFKNMLKLENFLKKIKVDYYFTNTNDDGFWKCWICKNIKNVDINNIVEMFLKLNWEEHNLNVMSADKYRDSYFENKKWLYITFDK